VGEYNLLAARYKLLLKDPASHIIQAYNRDSAGRGNWYVNASLHRRVQRLIELSEQGDGSWYWDMAWKELMLSDIYLISCLNKVMPHWHLEHDYRRILKLISEVKELIKNKHSHI
jgi:hypothetical protein